MRKRRAGPHIPRSLTIPLSAWRLTLSRPPDQETARKALERPFNRAALEEILTRRFFFRPSFEIYNGVAGLYDLGPPGCAVQANILSLWRQHFVLEEQMLEVDCTIMTKDEVFK